MYISIKIQHREKLINDELILVISPETHKSTSLANVNVAKTPFVFMLIKESTLHILLCRKILLFWLNQVGISA